MFLRETQSDYMATGASNSISERERESEIEGAI